MERQPPISEKTKISIALVIVVVTVVWTMAIDHGRIGSLETGQTEMRSDVKEVLRVVTRLQVCVAAGECRVSISRREPTIEPASATRALQP